MAYSPDIMLVHMIGQDMSFFPYLTFVLYPNIQRVGLGQVVCLDRHPIVIRKSMSLHLRCWKAHSCDEVGANSIIQYASLLDHMASYYNEWSQSQVLVFSLYLCNFILSWEWVHNWLQVSFSYFLYNFRLRSKFC